MCKMQYNGCVLNRVIECYGKEGGRMVCIADMDNGLKEVSPPLLEHFRFAEQTRILIMKEKGFMTRRSQV